MTKRKMEEITAKATPLAALEALRRNLLYNMLDAVDGSDMREIVAAQAEKAKTGDSKAAKLLIEMVQAGNFNAGRDINITTTHNNFISDTRRMIVGLMLTAGPQTPEKISERLHLMLPDTLQALNHPWFEKEGSGWKCTDQARSEALLESK